MAIEKLAPKYRELLQKLTAAARETWNGANCSHTTLVFVVSVSNIPKLMGILAALLPTGIYASTLYFCDWSPDTFQVTVLDPDKDFSQALTARCVDAGITLVFEPLR